MDEGKDDEEEDDNDVVDGKRRVLTIHNKRRLNVLLQARQGQACQGSVYSIFGLTPLPPLIARLRPTNILT